MPTNTAASLGSNRARLVVGAAPYTSPRADQIVVRNRAVAINPVDWMIQAVGDLIYPWLKYPFVLGTDVAGDVVEVGSAVTRFRVGDRVLGLAVGSDKDTNARAEGAFQEHTVLLDRLASPIPDTMSYQDAAVLPLGIATAACGLFQEDQLALDHPTDSPKPTGTTVLIWGGSTSVGSNAIQLAVAAGYEVITTASPRNFEYVRGLGASEVFDYRSPTVVADITAALSGKTLAGTLAVGKGSSARCVAIVLASEGSKSIASASTPVSFEKIERSGIRWHLPLTMLRIGVSTGLSMATARVRGVRMRFFFATTLKNNEVGPAIFEHFLPQALAEGRYVAAPSATVVGTGLGAIQDALDTSRKGVSASKVVVTL